MNYAFNTCVGLLFALSLMQLGGCSTHAKRLRSPRLSFYSNDLSTAHKQLEKLNEKKKHDATVIELDLAMVELMNADYSQAEQRLRTVRDTWDGLEKKSLAEEATSYLTDDQRTAYSGEDYERLLVRVMLTLCSLMQDGVDAESYSLQTLAKQQELFERRKLDWNDELSASYCVPPIAPYLRGVLREATLREYGDAHRYYEQTENLLPDAPFLLQDLQRTESGVHSAADHGVLYVIAMVGRGPYKAEARERPTQQALQVADVILNTLGKHSVPPTLAPVKVPEIVSPAKPFDVIGVEIDGAPISTTLPITDLHRLAVDSYAEKRPHMVARTVVRRVLKKGTIYAAKDQLDATTDIASLAFDAAGVLWEASESADTRCWGLLPREFQILRVELPAGVHQLHLEPVAGGKPVGLAVPCQVDIRDAQNTYVLSYWPGLEPIGQVLVSQ